MEGPIGDRSTSGGAIVPETDAAVPAAGLLGTTHASATSQAGTNPAPQQ